MANGPDSERCRVERGREVATILSIIYVHRHRQVVSTSGVNGERAKLQDCQLVFIAP